MSDQNKKVPTFEKLHKKPVTRREFLSSGLLPFSASMILPSWINLFANSGVAQAQELICASGGASGLSSFVCLKLNGGAGLAANWIPLDKSGQLLPSYSKIGLGKGSRLNVVYEFSNHVPFYSGSGFLDGVRTRAAVTTLSKTAFVAVPVRSQDDSSGNKFDLSGMVTKAGIKGRILPNLGKANTETGLAATYAILKPPAPLIVSRYDDIVGSLGVSGSLSNLSQTQKEKLFSTVTRITASQANEIRGLNGGKTLSQLVQCANIGNTNLITNSTSQNISPLGNANFSAVWGLTNNTSTASQDFVFGSMVYNSINGNAGTVNLDLGGYDYHDGTRTNGDAKDRTAGEVVGKILESFAVMNKKGFVVVCSDGGVASAESDDAGSVWTSDRGTGGVMYMLAYNPLAAPQSKGTQVGQFTEGQVADDTFFTGGSPEKAAAAIFANYMSFNSKTSLIESVIPRVFEGNQIDLVTKIAA